MSKITYQDCLNIVKNCDNFYEKIEIVEGQKVSIFNYILSVYDLFKNPLKDNSIQAFELRGLTFVHQDNQEPKRHLMLNKFLNINEGPDDLYDVLKDWEVIRIQEKEDGSMIRFIKFNNGAVLPKTKAAFTNEQCTLAKQVYDSNDNLQKFIKETLNNNLVAIFELVSPFNKIVCDYKETDLVLLQLREESTGNYLDIYNHELVKKYKLRTTKNEPLVSIEALIQKKETDTNTEGYIATLKKNNQTRLVKFKTNWYMERFRIIEKAVQENVVIALILDEQVDDALSLLDPTSEYYQYISEIRSELNKHVSQRIKDITSLAQTFSGDRRKFAEDNLKNINFPYSVRFLGVKDIDPIEVFKCLKTQLKKDTYRLKNAREFLKGIGFKTDLKLATRKHGDDE